MAISEWIGRDNTEQHEWIVSYLRKKELSATYVQGKTIYAQLVFELEALSKKSNGLYYISKMKGAWSVKQCRKKSGKKSYSFQLKTSTYDALKKLTKKQTLNNQLERLILDTYHLQQELKREYDIKRKDKIAELENKYGKKPKKLKLHKSFLDYIVIESHLKDTKELLEQERNKNNELLRELFEYIVVMEDAGVTISSLTTAQKSAALQRLESVRAMSPSDIAKIAHQQTHLDLDEPNNVNTPKFNPFNF